MVRPHHACAALALLLSMLALCAPPAQAQIRRCVTADGGHVYTDRACADLGASERLPRLEYGSASRPIRRDCSRRLQDLVFELTAAIDSRDVNRLAGIYHWPGTSSRTGYAIMGRLDAIVNRPLVDVTPLQPPPPPPPVSAAPPDALVWRTAPVGGPAAAASAADLSAADLSAADLSAADLSAADPSDPPADRDADASLPDAVRAAADRDHHARRPPTGLVVDQTVANRITPLQTVFSLRRHLGCWWVSL